MLADPYFPVKAAAGLPDEIVPCIRCNDGCQERSFKRFQAVLCTVNPLLGNEGMVTMTAAPRRLNVAVVGGGPGGMQAAQTLARRGHRVTLFERRALGGLLVEGSVPAFKTDLRLLIVNMESRLKTLGVRVERREVRPQELAGSGFEHVVVAIGGVPVPRRFPGSDHPKVADGCAVLRAEAQIGPRVVVVGGGLVGCEVALHLAQLNHQVSIVTRREDFMGEGSDTGIAVEHSNRSALLELIERHHVDVRTGLQVVQVDDEGVQFADRSGRALRLAADSVVLSSGFGPQPGFAEELAGLGMPVSSVGDCVQPRKIFDAIHEAFAAAMRIGDAALDQTESPFFASA
jgi:NADPH-dependent 2,4-dienoyl-CoA reductase/sulfur reductase-like enzyme